VRPKKPLVRTLGVRRSWHGVAEILPQARTREGSYEARSDVRFSADDLPRSSAEPVVGRESRSSHDQYLSNPGTATAMSDWK